ncbi:hypothetical protein CCAX7_007620 [Capsulimonas corticalis]|uniref:Uncharacterized protein n=1 Tax=Capsulimonas corticalis TaxID=2219043 RepID=A0A402D1R2_9BACT|nr:hypothetical protein [Capsulimonas corticalis]BDI28711.1 hypothetical protein CCAX7_007620 [Capsulimonas corticalis]
MVAPCKTMLLAAVFAGIALGVSGPAPAATKQTGKAAVAAAPEQSPAAPLALGALVVGGLMLRLRSRIQV